MRVTWYARYTCVQGETRVYVYVRVYVRACMRYVVTSGRGSKRQRGKRGPWGGGRGGEERRVEGGWQSVGR